MLVSWTLISWVLGAAAVRNPAVTGRRLDPTVQFVHDNNFGDFVRMLDDGTFDAEAIRLNNTLLFVDFYMPWCPHCRLFKAKWSKIARLLSTLPHVWFAAVDCTVSLSVCARSKIESGPTLIAFRTPASSNMPLTQVAMATGNLEFVDAKKWVAATIRASRMLRAGEGDRELAALDADSGAGLGATHTPVPDLRLATSTHDLAAAIYASLHVGVFLGSDALAPEPPPAPGAPPDTCGTRRCALERWIEAILDTIPKTESLRSALVFLRAKNDSEIRREEWSAHVRSAAGGVAGHGFAVPYNACAGDLHGFPCGLWQVFHALVCFSTNVNALRNLKTVTMYVQHLFLCAQCQQHFAQMASSVESRVQSRADAVMWLWDAHNAVSRRIAPSYGILPDQAEFPTVADCAACRTDQRDANGTIIWNQPAVLAYLDQKYNFTMV